MTSRAAKLDQAQRRAMTRLCQSIALPHGRRAVLHAVVSLWWAKGKGVIHPGIAAIAAKAKVSERTAQYAMRDLEALGIIAVTANVRGGRQSDGRGRATEFTIRDTALVAASKRSSGELVEAIERGRAQRAKVPAKGATKGATKGARRVQGLHPVLGYRENRDSASEAVRNVGRKEKGRGQGRGGEVACAPPPGSLRGTDINLAAVEAEGSA